MSGHQRGVRKVVVTFKPEMLRHEGKGFSAARIRELGLTTYGKTTDEALDTLEKLFHRFVARHREQGTLEKVLSLSNAKWCWEDEYTSDLPYKDVTPRRPAFRKEGESRPNLWADLPQPLAA